MKKTSTLNKIKTGISYSWQHIKRKVMCVRARSEIVQVVATSADLDTCLDRIINLIQERLSINFVGVFFADSTQQWSVFRYGAAKEPRGAEGIRILKQHGHKVYLKNEISLIDYREGSLYQSASLAPLAQHQSVPKLKLIRRPLYASPLFGYTGSAILIPLRTLHGVIGTLGLESFYTQASFSQYDLSALLPLADQVARVCENYIFPLQAQNQAI